MLPATGSNQIQIRGHHANVWTSMRKQEPFPQPLRHLMGTSGSKQATMAAKEFVDATLLANKVVVFSKSYCPYCSKAKSALSQFLSASQFLTLEVGAVLVWGSSEG